MHDVANLLVLAQRVRNGILAVPAEERPPMFKNFPRGSCGWASLLLGAALADRNIDGFLYVCGEREGKSRGCITSHAWLASEELILDITADQFADSAEPMVVARNSDWHKSFVIVRTGPADFRDSLGPGTYPLLATYARVKKSLE